MRSELEWEAMIRQMARGDYALQLTRLGSYEEVMRVQARRCGGLERNQPALSRALGGVLRSWRIWRRAWTEQAYDEAACLISLTAVLVPERGAEYLVTLLSLSEDAFLALYAIDERGILSLDLRRRALLAMRSYFPAPVASEHPLEAHLHSPDTAKLYARYVDVLRAHLGVARCSVDAAEGLIRLGELRRDDRWPLELQTSELEELITRLAHSRSRNPSLGTFQWILLNGGEPHVIERYYQVSARVVEERFGRISDESVSPIW